MKLFLDWYHPHTSHHPGHRPRLALTFDGVDDYFDCGQAETLLFKSNTAGMTVSLWLKMDQWPSGDAYAYLIGRGTTAFTLSTDPDPKAFRFWKSNGAAGYESVKLPCDTFALNGWNHVAVTFDQMSKTSRFYCNGVLAQTKADWSAPDLYIESQARFYTANSSRSWYQGAMDNIHVYRRALSSQEITTLWTQGGSK